MRFLEYMWHVMVHCKHSRLAKALRDQSHSKWQRGHSLESSWMSFSLLSFGGASFQRASRSRGRGWTAGRPCNKGEGSSCPLFLSIHKLVCFFSFCSWPWSASSITACPSWTCPRWQGLPAPCLGHSACAVRPGSAGRSSARREETECLRQSWHHQRLPES